jgi:predicted CoA-substrate-specific enzyme activase
MTSIPEPEAVEQAFRFVVPADMRCRAIVSAGGETFMGYLLNARGEITDVLSGNKCASGTGEFFIQQIRRMNVDPADAARWSTSATPYRVSGRCAVFCKSDCTHATNKGVPKSEVTAGLCRMMADKILELLKNVERRQIMLVGGTARNQTMVAYLDQEIEGLIIPEQAPYFEALGAALWALANPVKPFAGLKRLFVAEPSWFDYLPPLSASVTDVNFKTMSMRRVKPGDECILGLDVGSTTTKAVLLRRSDNAMVASIYLRTEGDPVGAARQCYRALVRQLSKTLDPAQISISGLGVCGSGRQIAGLHAMTEGVINEIVAHAAAAAHFDPEVDTIFEIGGQDAKYTYVINQVPSDYAMNEACSAGTGSFLEEAAFETLGVSMTNIADIALQAQKPPNFNDQCAAFIASDIKSALHEGISLADIVAGLVYSICMNYVNRVKGNRKVGRKIFMQGGVCYNRAVPLAMASLVGKPIVVPPEPGLMGAFGVALVVKERMTKGMLAKQRFDLNELAKRSVRRANAFTCKGGKERCDRACRISMIVLEGKRYPFGGACNRYENLRCGLSSVSKARDLVRARQRLMTAACGNTQNKSTKKVSKGRVGLNRSFMVHTYLPLLSHFFDLLNFDIILPQCAAVEGVDHSRASFCYPAQLAHRFFHQLLDSDPPPDFIFLPHFKALPSFRDKKNAQTCPIVQGEAYYLRAAFQPRLRELQGKGVRILSPLLDLTRGVEHARSALVTAAGQMGIGARRARAAFAAAVEQQKAFQEAIKARGEAALASLSLNPEQTAVVVFSRSYNGLADEANMGIPRKLATRGVTVLPMDMLPFEDEPLRRHMYWGMGQQILKAARFVRRHRQLFGLYITNFACGPDSFLVGYFRDLMGPKPSLALELDSHTADAGLETRIEAFLDIVAAHRSRSRLLPKPAQAAANAQFNIAQVDFNRDSPVVRRSNGQQLALDDPLVTLLFPSMGPLAVQAIQAVFIGDGFHARIQPPADEAVLKLGRAHTTCKECLPLQLTTGTLLSYLNNGRSKGEVLVYFMPTGSGPCRFGQYAVYMEELVKKLRIPDVAIFSLSSEDAYSGLGGDINRKGWWALVLAGIFEDMRAMLLANAKDPEKAMTFFEDQWAAVLISLEKRAYPDILEQVSHASQRLSTLQLKAPVDSVPKVLLTGEIFVRHDPLSRQHLTRRLAQAGFATVCAPIAEWLHYSDYLLSRGMTERHLSVWGQCKLRLRRYFKLRDERQIRSMCAKSGLLTGTIVPVETIVANASRHISPNLTGEAVLTIGAAITEIVSHVCGVLAIGPFGCMPNRISEAILSEAMSCENKLAMAPQYRAMTAVLSDTEALPFLAIESDGFPLPQLINAKLEAFCLRAGRLHTEMQRGRSRAPIQ